MVLAVYTSHPIAPRLKKIANLFKDEIAYVTWCRDSNDLASYTGQETVNEYVFDDSNKSKKKQYLDVFAFRAFVGKTIKEVKPDYIVCRHWESFVIVSSLKPRNARIVYDVCDTPSTYLPRLFERMFLNDKVKVTLASRFYIPIYDKYNSIVLENRIASYKPIEKVVGKSLRITYLGVIRYPDILKNLIKACSSLNNIELVLWGDGKYFTEINDFIKENNYPAVMKGAYTQQDIPAIYEQSDIIWCAYPYKNDNVKLAISNKYFETIAYRTPGIFSVETSLGHYVDENGIGFVVDPYSIYEIKELIETIQNNQELRNARRIAIENFDENFLWDDYYNEFEKWIKL